MLEFCRWLPIAILTLTVPTWAAAQCNTPPQAVDDVALHQGDPIYVDVLANDLEPDGERLSIASVATDCDGSVSEAAGVVVMTPNTQVAEACTITYQVADERGAVDSATVQVDSSGALFKDGFESGDTSTWAEAAR